MSRILLTTGLLVAAGRVLDHAPPPAAPLARHVTRADSSCLAAFDSLVTVFRHDYPGYRDKVPGHGTALAALTDSVRKIARTSDQYQICIPALQRWVRFFRDPHIVGPWQASPPNPHAATSSSPAALPADDPDRPSLVLLDDSTALLRLPSFEADYKPAIDSLLDVDGSRLRATRYLIVDVRGNGGGYTGAYANLTPLLATNAEHYYGQDVLASRGNIAWYKTLRSNRSLTADDRARIQSLIIRMQRQIGHLVEFTPDTVVRPAAILPLPARVAVLVDSGCASTCEDLVLAAQQSTKVTVIGPSHTAGAHDYGEVHNVWLPGWRRVRIPTARARGPRIDNVGIAPAVVIPGGTSDVIGYVQRYLYTLGTSDP